MKEWKELDGGAVLTAIEATAADLKESEAPFLYSRMFIPQEARVRVLVEIDGTPQVVFDDTITPALDRQALFEVRVRRHPDIDPEKMPTDPALAVRIDDPALVKE